MTSIRVEVNALSIAGISRFARRSAASLVAHLTVSAGIVAPAASPGIRPEVSTEGATLGGSCSLARLDAVSFTADLGACALPIAGSAMLGIVPDVLAQLVARDGRRGRA